MDFNMGGTLKTAINDAAKDFDRGEVFGSGKWALVTRLDSTTYFLAKLQLPDGRIGQVQLKITTDEDDFISIDEGDGLMVIEDQATKQNTI